MESTVSLQIVDYVVIALTLLISLGIGVVFAVIDFRNDNRLEYLLGGRRMLMLPVAFSIFATYTSGIALVGLVTDIYMTGVMAAAICVGIALAYCLAAYTVVPLLYPLRLTSLYEYLQLRFQSNILRMFVVMVGMLQTLCYMAIALLSPALALQAGADLPMWVSVGIVGVIGTVYTAIGGIKSVVWTDVFQSLVMIGGVFTIITKGTIIVGGVKSVWNISRAGGRANFSNFNLDPRISDTWWGATIGAVFFWLGNICNQSTSQRISAMRSVNEAKKAFLLNGAVVLFFACLMAAFGWVMYAYFAYIRCDPFQGGLISNANQMTPYFVMHALTDLPGMGGIYMAMVFSASLSTLSSGISALAANTIEDLLKTPLKTLRESTVTFITKIVVFGYGLLIIGLAYGASSLKGPLTQTVISGVGACAGPIVGIFLLGALVPWSNKYGAIGGGAVSLLFNLWIAIGNQMYMSNMTFLPPPTSDMCNRNSSIIHVANVSMPYFINESLFLHEIDGTSKGQTERRDRYGFFLYDISVDWYGFIGTAVCFMFGMAISYCSRRRCVEVIDSRLLFPFAHRICLSQRSVNHQESEGIDANCKLILYDRYLNNTTSPQNDHNIHQDVDEYSHVIR
ncbi:hypothetical protein BsWGS_11607 [Bradybaena similaris]